MIDMDAPVGDCFYRVAVLLDSRNCIDKYFVGVSDYKSSKLVKNN